MTIALLPDDPHDRVLLSHVHPSDWVNPTPAPRYNLVVIGAGTAGLICAAAAAGLGARVALIERELLGGDCLNVGCVPSKALLRAARAAHAVRTAASYGVKVASSAVDFSFVMDRVRRLRAELAPHDSAARFRHLGVDVFLGHGRFVGPDSIEVAGQLLRFARAVIATGARAVRPNLPGLAEVGFLTNETVFALTRLPARLAVLGGGPIGCELAQAFARLGSQVTLLQRGPRILPREEADAAQLVHQALEQEGVEILPACTITLIQRQASNKVLHFQTPTGNQQRVVEEILVAAGRQPNVDHLDLDKADVRFDPRQGVEVNDYLRTSNPRIYAAGDVCSSYKFTHAADALARIALRNALFFGRARASALTIPWCTYTDPELAHVGLNEEQARLQGIPVQTFTLHLEQLDRAVLEGAAQGFVRVLVRRGTDRVLGATVVASHAGEMIGEISLAMTHGLGLKRWAQAIHPYPTQADALRKLGDAYNRTRLTPVVKRLLNWILAWRR